MRHAALATVSFDVNHQHGPQRFVSRHTLRPLRHDWNETITTRQSRDVGTLLDECSLLKMKRLIRRSLRNASLF